MPKSINDENFKRRFYGYEGKALLRTEPGGFLIGSQYEANADKITQLKQKEDDTWVVTFPKSGLPLFISELIYFSLYLLFYNC